MPEYLSGRSADLLWEHIVSVPDFPKPGVNFFDLSPLLESAHAFATAIDEMAIRLGRGSVDRVVGIEARGFPYAAALAYHLAAGFVALRKPGKLPRETDSVSFDLEYGVDSLEVHLDALVPGERVVIVDDVLATGGTAAAAVDLVRGRGAVIVNVAVILELSFLSGRQRVESSGVPVVSLLGVE